MKKAFALRALAVIGVAAVPLAAALVEPKSAARERGGRLFRGAVPLTGRLAGHDEPLPPDAVRCRNCHELESVAAKAPGVAARRTDVVESVGPPLGPSRLTGRTGRRGGPPSSYDTRAFCRLLRDGVDPAEIVIPRLMPRYELSDEECDALWQYLVTR